MKRIITMLGLLLFASFTFAQNIYWQKTIGGSDVDQLNMVKSTPDSGVIVGGFSSSGISGNKTDNNISIANDYWVIKLDKTGNIEWQNAIGGSNEDELYCLTVCNDGGYLLGGHSTSNISGDKTSNCDPNGLPPFDIWIVKLNAAGSISWQKNIGGNGVDMLLDMKKTPDGGFILGASSSSDISGDKTENHFGALDKKDYWILKLDSLGNIQWQKTIGGDLTEELRSIALTFDGGYIVAGGSESPISGNKTQDAHMFGIYYYMDYWIVKLDSVGNIEWQKVYGGDYIDVPLSIEQTTDGNFIVGGASRSDISFEKTEPIKGNADYWILKIDQLGNIIWQKDYGGSDDESLGVITQRGNGNFLVVGSSNSPISGDKTQNTNGMSDIWLLNLDPAGNILWQNDIGGASEDFVFFHDFSVSGDSYLGGYSNSNISGDKTENSYGDFDYWVLKLNGLESYVRASAFLDFNGNNLQDVNEPYYHYGNFEFAYDSILNYSNGWGPVTELVDTGKIYYDFIPYHNYFNLATNKDSNMALVNQTDTFVCALHPIPNINDLAVHIIPTEPVRPGFDTEYSILISNFGSTSIPNTEIKLTKKPNQNYTFSLPVATNLIADSIWWNLGTLLPFSDTLIQLTLYNLPPPVNTIGDTNHLFVQIFPVLNDNNAGDNQFDLSQIFIGSFDPNNKIENHAGEMSYYAALNGEELTYTVNFQNTGTDTAFHIFIRDTLDDKIDFNSFRMMNASHPYTVSANGRFLQWDFKNINLVDSFTNEPGSHGSIFFKVKTKQLVQKNEIIHNTAAIFFDYNLPIYTNTSGTKLIDYSGVGIHESSIITNGIYPNPVDDFIYFNNAKPGPKADIKIIDVTGKIVRRLKNVYPVNVSDLKTGTYFLSVSEGEIKSTFRFQKR